MKRRNVHSEPVSSTPRTPQAVIDEPALSRREKLHLLAQWEKDARLRQVADEENMTGHDFPGEDLRRIRMAIRTLSMNRPDASRADA